jgi:hypothetical protein
VHRKFYLGSLTNITLRSNNCLNRKTKILAFLSIVVLAFSSGLLATTAYIPTPDPSITLSPSSGFATTITGVHFDHQKTVAVYWNDVALPYISSDTQTSNDGSFIVMVTAPTTTPGSYTIKVTVNHESVSACFTVPDTTGPQGPQGNSGAAGATGAQGAAGVTTVVSPSSILNGVITGKTDPSSTLYAPLGTLYLNLDTGDLWEYSTTVNGVWHVTGWNFVFRFVIDAST